MKWLGQIPGNIQNRNEHLAQEILSDKRVVFMEKLGKFLGRIRAIRDIELNVWEDNRELNLPS